MAGRAPGLYGVKASQSGVRVYPYWVPWDGAPEDAAGNIVGDPTGDVRLLPVDKAHSAMIRTGDEGTGRSPYEVKGYVRLEHAPAEAKRVFAAMWRRAVARAEGQRLPAPEWTVLYRHFAEEGERLSEKVGKGADAA